MRTWPQRTRVFSKKHTATGLWTRWVEFGQHTRGRTEFFELHVSYFLSLFVLRLWKVPFTSFYLDLCFLVIRSLSGSAPRHSWFQWTPEGNHLWKRHSNCFSYCCLLTESKGGWFFVFFFKPRSSCLMRLVTITPTGVPHLYRLRGKYRARSSFGGRWGGRGCRSSGFRDCFDGVSRAAMLTLCRWSSVTDVLICFKIFSPFPLSSWGLLWEIWKATVHFYCCLSHRFASAPLQVKDAICSLSKMNAMSHPFPPRLWCSPSTVAFRAGVAHCGLPVLLRTDMRADRWASSQPCLCWCSAQEHPPQILILCG